MGLNWFVMMCRLSRDGVLGEVEDCGAKGWKSREKMDSDKGLIFGRGCRKLTCVSVPSVGGAGVKGSGGTNRFRSGCDVVTEGRSRELRCVGVAGGAGPISRPYCLKNSSRSCFSRCAFSLSPTRLTEGPEEPNAEAVLPRGLTRAW